MAEKVKMVAICTTCGGTDVKRDKEQDHPGVGHCAHCGQCYIDDRPASAVNWQIDEKLGAITKSYFPPEDFVPAGFYPKPDAEFQARMEQRRDERLKRDSKLREEWLGRNFELTLQHELLGEENLPLRLVGYYPQAEIVEMQPMWGSNPLRHSHIPWTTDQFWSLYNAGLLKEV